MNISLQYATEMFISSSWSSLTCFISGLTKFFYIVPVEHSHFQQIDQVPNFYNDSWPYFILFIFLENIILWTQNKPIYRINDSLTSLSHGLIQECGRMTFRGAGFYAYIKIYDSYRLTDLPWNSSLSWYLALIGIDFCYYWAHRAGHEVHILWAQHQVHHSSEEFNVAVGLRQSIFQGWCNSFFYLPLALIIPPSHFAAHQQFNLLYQFWIHTEVVNNLGPLEYVFNTPQHHRLHHGSNIYCLDKNYGGVFIIWDRIFGTFRSKTPQNDDIIYGLVHQPLTLNPIYLQSFYTAFVIEKYKSLSSWHFKLAALFYGPSWQPGRPRLGIDEDKIDVTNRSKYNVPLPLWLNSYLLLHFAITACYTRFLGSETSRDVNLLLLLCGIILIIFSLTVQGMFFDKNPVAPFLESARCIVIIFLLFIIHIFKIPIFKTHIMFSVFILYILSIIFWVLYIDKRYDFKSCK